MAHTVTRRNLPVPDETVDSPDVPRDITALANALGLVATLDIGPTLPSSGMIIGDIFVLTSDLTLGPNGTPYWWDGTAWRVWVASAQLAPTGTIAPYAGSVDPPGGAWLIADGRLIDKTIFATFFSTVGHAFNGGVDPGGGLVKLPDMRGRVPVGTDNMGTSAGAANRQTGHTAANARGLTGGVDMSTLSLAQLAAHTHSGPSHAHTFSASSAGQSANHSHTSAFQCYNTNVGSSISIGVSSGADSFRGNVATGIESVGHVHSVSGTSAAGGTGASGSAGSGTSHENMPPYQVAHFIVKVL